MNAGSREPTDQQLADIVGYLARVCLETERGLRPVGQLTRFMDPAAALRFRALLTLGRFDGGPVHPADIGSVHLARHGDGTVFASVVTRTHGRRWGALSLKLAEHDGAWKIVDLRRVLAASRPAPRRRETTEPPPVLGRGRAR